MLENRKAPVKGAFLYAHSVSPWGRARTQDKISHMRRAVSSVSPWGRARTQDYAETDALTKLSVSPWGRARTQDRIEKHLVSKGERITLGKGAHSRLDETGNRYGMLAYHLGEGHALKTMRSSAQKCEESVSPWGRARAQDEERTSHPLLKRLSARTRRNARPYLLPGSSK